MPSNKPNIHSVYNSRVKGLDKEVAEHLRNSVRSGNTLDESHFDTYLKDLAEKHMNSQPTGMSKAEDAIVSNTLYNHAHIDLKEDYRTSLKINPRTPNNKLPKTVDDDWLKTAKEQLKIVRSGIRTKAKEVLQQSLDTGRTPTQSQYLEYLSGQMNTVIDEMPTDYQDYVRAYVQEWINKTARDLYDSSLKAHPREVTSDFPWTKKPRTDQHPSAAKKNNIQPVTFDGPMTEYTDTYRSFSGHDMVCTIDMPLPDGTNIIKVVGALQTITYSINANKFPIRCIGDMNAKGYVFGPRTIAGTMIFSVFDKHWMHDIMEEYISNKRLMAHFLADEVPPFNMTISCANEYGHKARLAIYGITLVNEGQVMSINDVYTENTYEFFALDVDYLSDVVSKGSNVSPDSQKLPKTNGSSSSSSAPKVVYLDKVGKEDQEHEKTLEDNVAKSSDPDKPDYHDSDYYVGTTKEAMYAAIEKSRENTYNDLLQKYGQGEIVGPEFQRQRTKIQETYAKRMEEAAAYYEKTK